MSNEHPDMSGNPCDAPFLCEYCGKEFREENAWQLPQTRGREADLLFCSNDCCNEYLESRAP